MNDRNRLNVQTVRPLIDPERCSIIKHCLNLSITCVVFYHLAGTKKVQQALAMPNELERFIESHLDCEKIRYSFAKLYGLEKSDPNSQQAIDDAIDCPQNYVMKPQREGGGNNFYDSDVRVALQALPREEIEAYILMSRIRPKDMHAVLVRNQQIRAGLCINELGMFCISLFDDAKVVFNEHAGHLLRTKLSNTNEGGVATGYAVLSSPFLI